jgi:hypothetical protein
VQRAAEIGHGVGAQEIAETAGFGEIARHPE